MIYLSEALFNSLSEKSKKALTDVVKEVLTNVSSHTTMSASGYRNIQYLTPDGSVIFSDARLKFIPNSVQNSSIFDTLIDNAEKADRNEKELRELRALKANIDGIKNYLK